MNLSTFKLEDFLAQHEFKAPYLLCCSDAESFSMQEIVEMANPEDRMKWDTLRLGYTEAWGLPELRHQIAHSLYPNLKGENILGFVGAEEGIYCSLYTLCEAGDHVIVLTPCYQSLLEIPKNKGCSITTIELREENQWRIDIEAIRKAITSKTKCLVINFPHNPTGQVISQDELDSLIKLLDSAGIWLFSDEVYRLLGEPQQGWAQPAASLYNRAISLGVMSKAFGMAGLRIGWISCQDQKMLNQIQQMKNYISICSSAPAEILSLITLKNKDRVLERNNQIVGDNLAQFDAFVIENATLLSWVRPQGGCIGFIYYNSDRSSESFCEQALREKGVLLMPPSIFEARTNHFRVGFGRKNMPEALEKLTEHLKAQ